MKLYIMVGNDGPISHPILEGNLREAGYDIDNLPNNIVPFTRVERPEIGVYQKFDTCGESNCEAFDHNGLTYEFDAETGGYKDVWHVAEMTSDEKTEKQNSVKNAFNALGYSSWVFDEDRCRMLPPNGYPSDYEYKTYIWSERYQQFKAPPNDGLHAWNHATEEWVSVSDYPTDGKTYVYDFDTDQWVEVS